MKVPAIRGIIRRRILVNYRVDPDVMQRQLPAPFQPQLHRGAAIAGVCLIRLEVMRPKGIALPVGLASENAAHRIAVCWDEGDETREGVYVPRRDTDSLLNRLSGGRLFPGEYHPARFRVKETADAIDYWMRSDDGEVEVSLRGRVVAAVPRSSCFGSLAVASAFFEAGSLGFSARSGSDELDAMRLSTDSWQVEALALDEVYSSYFADEARFPPGSVEFDCALLMRDIPHEWHPAPALRGDAALAAAGAGCAR